MKQYMVWSVVAVCVGCGGNEPASIPDMAGTPVTGVMMDMGSMTPRDLGGQPQLDMPRFDADQDVTPSVDMGLRGDQGMPGDQGITPDMPPADQGGGGGRPVCGNGVVEAGELCDGNCPTSCDDGDACTMDSMAGGADTCNVVCINQAGSGMCGTIDGCCPAGCTEGMDEDCSVDAMLDCSDPATWPAAWTQLEDAVVAEVNMRRAAGGSCGATMHPPAPALVAAAPLREAGRCHALDMVRRDYFASRSPEDQSALDRAQAAGYIGAQSVGQDIGTFEGVTALVDNWMTREGNCNHILNARYDEIGVGYMESSMSMYPRYWVQVVADKP